MGVVVFPLAASVETYDACLRPTAEHHVSGRWVGCRADVVIGRDQQTFARRLRLARLQSRVPRLRPFGIGVDGLEAR